MTERRKFSGMTNFPEPVKTGTTALKRGGIDWTVRAEQLSDLTADTLGGERWVATIRNDSNEIIGVNGTRHTIIQNDALAAWGDAIIQMNAGFKFIGGGGFPNSDKTYLVLAGERTLSFGQPDDVGFNAILLVNDFNGNSPLTATGFVGRLFCTNQISGLARKGSQRLVKVAHTASSTWKVQAAKDTLRAAVHEMDEVEEELKRMLTVRLSATTATDIAVGLRPDEETSSARAITTWENKRAAFVAELNAPWNEPIKGTALAAVMAAQGIDEHGSRSANRDKARVDRLITANFPTMHRVLAGVAK